MFAVAHKPETTVAIQLCLRINDDLLASVEEWLPNKNKTVVHNDSENFLWTTAEMSPELLNWIRAMGPRVEVMHPLSLREHIRRSLVQTLMQYRIA